jgi:glycine cleavage system T protein
MEEPSTAQTKKTPLHAMHDNVGARFEEWFGWEMPSFYSSPLGEHTAVRECVGIVDLSYSGAVRIGGSEGAQFLNGLVTSDVKGLQEGKLQPAAFLTGHGKVRALCRIARLGQDYLIITDPQTHDKVFKYVFPFSYAGDFQVADVSDEYRLLSIQGPGAEAVMKEVSFEPVAALGTMDSFRTTIAGHHCAVTGSDRTGETGFDLFLPASALTDIWEFILLKGSFHEILPVGQTALDSLRIEAGKLVYGVDVDETNMMLETGMSDAVSFTKGCYTGQEAVAMATYRGHVSKQMAGLRVEGNVVPPERSVIAIDGKEVGYVTSSVDSPTLGGIVALGYIKYGFTDEGRTVRITDGTNTCRATIVPLPFYRRSS